MNETIQTIKSLRTTRGAFSERTISEADLRTILECAVCAANAAGRQNYSIVVTSNTTKMKQICGHTGDKLLLFCVDYTRVVDMAEHLGHVFAVSDLAGFVTGSMDTILAAQNACVAARSLGIDSLFTNSFHHSNLARVYDILGLPLKHCFPMVALVLGYAKDEPTIMQERLSDCGVIHQEAYHRLTPAERTELVKEYDDPQLHLGLPHDWAKEGYKHYLDWFYTKWSRGTEDTRELAAALRKLGFIPKNEK